MKIAPTVLWIDNKARPYTIELGKFPEDVFPANLVVEQH